MKGRCTVLGTETTVTGKLGKKSTAEPTLALGNSSHMTTHTLRKTGRVKSEVAMCLHTSSIHLHSWYLHPFRKLSQRCVYATKPREMTNANSSWKLSQNV